MTPEQTVRQLIDAINRQDVAGINALLSPDHQFIDGLGYRVAGRDLMAHAWEGYFKLVPDYRIAVEQVLVADETVVVLGTASGTYAHHGALPKENAWAVPSAWRATVHGDHVTEWQVYADNEPMRRIMNREERERA